MIMLEPLTEREREILALISSGMSNQEIADTLYLSRGTVKAHSHNIYSKLGVTNRTQAVLKAQELGLLTGADVPGSKQHTGQPDLPKGNLPPQLTPFIGRKTELARMTEMLADDRVRLITLLGAGGMGKTRLAIEVARRAAGSFEDGTFFISLTRITSAKSLAPAIIDDMQLRFQASEKPEQQLLSYLRDKRLLLVLDNFEHLLDASNFLTTILQESPGTKIVVTSRERLNLSAEVVFVLVGLAYNVATDGTDPLQLEAVQLLLERAQVVRPGFELQPGEWPHVRRICRLTGGMPLALVLAASWLQMLTLEEIANELTHSIDILESQFRDLPARQRSMRATITASWKRLTAKEQRIFASLSAFRGGFTRQSAQRVTGASLSDLQKLVNCSFITVNDGRYQIHELLRQFAESELLKEPAQHREILILHCAYYAEFLHTRLEPSRMNQRHKYVEEVKAELNNIRAAWQWAIEHLELDALYRMAESLGTFWHVQSRYLEGIALFEEAVTALNGAPESEQRDLLTAILSTDLGYYYIRLGRLDEAETLFQRADSLFETLGFPSLNTTTDPLIGLALIASIRGHYSDATAIAEKTLHRNEALGNLSNQAYAFYVLTGINLAQGQYQQAREFGERAVAMTEQVQDRWLQAYCLIELGNVARALGDDETANRHYQASYAIREMFHDPEGMAVALNHLGQLALRRLDLAEAERLYRQSLAIYEEVHDQGGLATTLHGLGQVALVRGDYQACHDYLRRALHTASLIDYVPLLFAILLTVADQRLQSGRTEEGLQLLAFIRQHPSSNQETKDQAAQMLTDHGARDRDSASISVPEHEAPDDLTVVVLAVQEDLSRPA